MQTKEQSELVGLVNDAIRASLPFALGKNKIIFAGSCAQSLEENEKLEVLDIVKKYNNFDVSNDPYLEHDFGSFEYKGESYFFKFDYYDDDFKYYKFNGLRVLSILRSCDY